MKINIKARFNQSVTKRLQNSISAKISSLVIRFIMPLNFRKYSLKYETYFCVTKIWVPTIRSEHLQNVKSLSSAIFEYFATLSGPSHQQVSIVTCYHYTRDEMTVIQNSPSNMSRCELTDSVVSSLNMILKENSYG